MAERFDSLFAGISEADALRYIASAPETLDNPGLKYLAATRLGACHSEESLAALMRIAATVHSNLYDRIARRKALEALGRRKDQRSLPVLIDALGGDDEPAVVNAADAIARLAIPLNDEQSSKLSQALDGPDNQRRAVIQTHCRLEIKSASEAIRRLSLDDNPLVAGAALAYRARVLDEPEATQGLVHQLDDANAGRRRAAVIDLGDAHHAATLEALIRCPVSMPLRAKSALNILGDRAWQSSDSQAQGLLEQLLQDDPRELNLSMVEPVESAAEAIEPRLQHRDEAQQYAGAVGLLQMKRDVALSLIDHLRQNLGSDYGVHYLIANSIGLLGLSERTDAVVEALHEIGPQYAKSRVAAAWSCRHLQLIESERPLLEQLASESPWLPLKWSCMKVLRKL